MNVQRTETVFLDPWEAYYEKQYTQNDAQSNTQTVLDEHSTDNIVQASSSEPCTIHVEHEYVASSFEQTTQQCVEHEFEQKQDDSRGYHEHYQPHESQQPEQSHIEHQHIHEHSTQSIIESTNQSSSPAETGTFEIPSNDNFIPSSSQFGDNSDASGNDNNDQVRRSFVLHPYIQWSTQQPKKKRTNRFFLFLKKSNTFSHFDFDGSIIIIMSRFQFKCCAYDTYWLCWAGKRKSRLWEGNHLRF